MELVVKQFNELSAQELFEIYKLRVSVFVVEQSCPYQEVDDADRAAYHLVLRDEDGIQAYARVLPPGVSFDDAAAIDTARQKFSAESISLEAQVYAMPLYEKLGFRPASEEFLEDGIPHIKMTLK